MMDKPLKTVQELNAEMARLTAEYEDKISVIQREHEEEVQLLKEEIDALRSDMDVIKNDDMIKTAQLDLVKTLFGVNGRKRG